MGSGILPVVLGLILWNSVGSAGPGCRDNSQCRDLSSEAGILACSGSCRARLSLESPLFPGNGELQPLTESLRRYVMGHFRWNRFGRRNGSDAAARKREPAEGNQPGNEPGNHPGNDPGNGAETWETSGKRREDGKRSYSMEHFRWGKPVGRKRRPVKVYPNGAEEESAENSRPEFRREQEQEEEEEEEEEEEWPGWARDGSRLEKRYGGFMGSERARRPLVTLFRNAIGKGPAKDGQ